MQLRDLRLMWETSIQASNNFLGLKNRRGINKQKQYCLLGQVRTVQLVDVRLASTLTRSTGGALTENPECEQAPQMILIEDLRSETMRRHLSKGHRGTVQD